MENLKNGIRIDKLDVCPFFYPYDYSEKTKYSCHEEVNFFYVIEYCVKGFRRCKKFTERALLERKTPEEWVKTILWGFARLDLEGCFGVHDYIKCPIYPDCRIDIVYDHFVERCCKDFDKCDNFLKAAYSTSKPSYWARNLRIVLRVEGMQNRDKT